MRKRLKENHPFLERLQELEALCDKCGITIMAGSNDELVVLDNESRRVYSLLDLENDNPGITQFPSAFEYKVVYDDSL